jgi:hypothetical protein
MHPKTVRLIKNVVFAVVIVTAGIVIRQQNEGAHHPGWTIALWALSAWVVLRIGLGLKRGHALLREHAADGLSLKSVDNITTASMPESVRGAYGLEKRMYAAAWRALTRKPVPRRAEFSVSAGARSASMLRLGVAAVLALSAAGALALVQADLSTRTLVLLCTGLGFLALYLLAWLIGSRRLLHESGHDISLDFLGLDLGIRASGAVPMTAILRARTASGINELPPDDVWTLAPFDAPNVLVELDGVVSIEAQRFGYPVTLRKRFIALYVDEPARFLSAIAHALPASLPQFG